MICFLDCVYRKNYPSLYKYILHILEKKVDGKVLLNIRESDLKDILPFDVFVNHRAQIMQEIGKMLDETGQQCGFGMFIFCGA